MIFFQSLKNIEATFCSRAVQKQKQSQIWSMDCSVSMPDITHGKYYIPNGEATTNTTGVTIKDMMEEKCSVCRLNVSHYPKIWKGSASGWKHERSFMKAEAWSVSGLLDRW